MKEINQLIHCTKTIDILKSILKEGLYPSYTNEVFNGKNILIPMISFSNILFRDIGNGEVVNYGDYGIVVERDLALEKYQFNPVMYILDKGIVSKPIEEMISLSAILQILPIVKEFYKASNNCCEKFLDNIGINPILPEAENLINSINKETDDELIDAVKTISEKVFENNHLQTLLMKPYKVKDKNNKEWIAYNEREWRKSFLDLKVIREKEPKGTIEKDYTDWINKPKPHFKEDKYTLKIDLDDIKHIIVKTNDEIEEVKEYVRNELNYSLADGIVDTLQNLTEKTKFMFISLLPSTPTSRPRKTLLSADNRGFRSRKGALSKSKSIFGQGKWALSADNGVFYHRKGVASGSNEEGKVNK